MKIGFIGAGEVAQFYAKRFAAHGHEVLLSNSRGPESLAALAKGIGPNARAGTVKEAAEQALVILAVRWEHAEQALAGVSDWRGRILIDATNRMPNAGNREDEPASEIIAGYAPGAHLVKALNTLVVDLLKEEANAPNKLVLFLAGDDNAAKEKVSTLLASAEFFPIDIGSLSAGGKLQDFGGALSGVHLNLIRQLKFKENA